MAGAYCKFCDQRCFVLRRVPDDGLNGYAGGEIMMATCPGGMRLDREISGYDHTTAINPAEESRTNPDGYVEAQVAETTALMRSLWLAHHVEVMRLGGPVSDPARAFDAWLDAVRAEASPAALPWVEVRLDGSDRWHVFHFRTVAEAERWAHAGLGDWLADVGHIHDPAVCDDEH